MCRDSDVLGINIYNKQTHKLEYETSKQSAQENDGAMTSKNEAIKLKKEQTGAYS